MVNLANRLLKVQGTSSMEYSRSAVLAPCCSLVASSPRPAGLGGTRSHSDTAAAFVNVIFLRARTSDRWSVALVTKPLHQSLVLGTWNFKGGRQARQRIHTHSPVGKGVHSNTNIWLDGPLRLGHKEGALGARGATTPCFLQHWQNVTRMWSDKPSEGYSTHLLQQHVHKAVVVGSNILDGDHKLGICVKRRRLESAAIGFSCQQQGLGVSGFAVPGQGVRLRCAKSGSYLSTRCSMTLGMGSAAATAGGPRT